ncbi:RNA-directed DNA polymerase, eukaryota [Tanacetum coccineum]
MDHKQKQSGCVNEIKSKLCDIDKIFYQGGVNDELLLSRKDLMKQMQDIKSSEARDCMQKAKIQWAIEGDENSKFFHGIINRKRDNLSIKGIMVDGEWVDDPNRVKEEFRSHFATRFQAPVVYQSRLNFRFPYRLNNEQAADLENSITQDEIRNAVWGYGENKSPGPDGFTFEFFRKFWNVIGADVCVVVEWFFDHSSFSKGCNSSFVALILKIQDPKFVNDYRPISLIGSLYKVVTKVLANRLSSVISDLISDVQTAFLPNRQILDWRTHWTPYLFILVMESLHLSFSRVVDAGMFRGIRIDSSLMISHLFYADDVVFIGVGVPHALIIEAAMALGCSVVRTPFKYLGVVVGGNMSLIKPWDEKIGSTSIYTMSLYKVPKFVLNLMESIRRNFFNGIHGAEKKISWVKWSKVFAAKKNGGLGSVTTSFRRSARGGIEAHQLAQLQLLIEPTILSNSDDRWVWDLNGDGIFRVKDVRCLLDEFFLPKDITATRWVKTIPIKINVFAWKVCIDRLPTRMNLFRRDVQVPSLLCPDWVLRPERYFAPVFICALGLLCSLG